MFVERLYSYVGTTPSATLLAHQTPRHAICSAADVLVWWRATPYNYKLPLTTTFVITPDTQLWISDQRSEHVVCARGQAVFAAGEMTFVAYQQQVTIVGITNQSTGYCPEPESWSAIESVLLATNIPYPAAFTAVFHFRRCEMCATTNIVKDQWFECAVCGATLPQHWNYQTR
jgi:hypothetical protein